MSTRSEFGKVAVVDGRASPIRYLRSSGCGRAKRTPIDATVERERK